MFNNRLIHNHLMKACVVAVITIGLAACSSSSDNGDMGGMTDPEPTPTPTPEMACTDAGGRWNDDMTCTSAEELAAAGKAAANKVALTKKKAIATEANPATTAARPFDGPPFDTADGADNTANNYQVTVKHTGSAVEVTVVDGALPAENDPMFERAATFGDGQMLVRNIGRDREIIVLYTDIDAPEDILFGNASGYALTEDVDTGTTANDSYVVAGTDASKLGGSAIVPANKGGSQTLAVWADTEAAMGNVFSGTLDGASGKFRCTSGTCTIAKANDDDGTVSITGGGTLWFTPDTGATIEIGDSDYFTYGFWLDTTTKDGAIASYDIVQTFATSSLDAATGTLGDVEGTATYTGDAAGVYVHESKMEDGTLDTATSGRFTADVSLKAYFDDSTLRNANTIEGTISNFDLDGGPANSWNVDVSAGITSAFALENGVASGMDGNNGSLSGQFHSPDDREAADAPGVLVGEFNANFVNGAVAGAFGARAE